MTRLPSLLLLVAALTLPLDALAMQIFIKTPADTVLMNGKIYSGKVKNPWSQALAILDGQFSYVGDDVSALIGSNTVVYDLNGRTVIPSLLDGHSHPGMVALSSQYIELDDTSSKPRLMASITKMVEENPDVPVLIGGFWPNELFAVTGPHKSELDAIEPNRPMILFDAWAHTVWVNTKALEMAGVTRETKDLVPGFSFYQRDENGEATGWITESAASLFINLFQDVTPQVEQVLKDYLDYYQTLGVSSVLDAGNFGLDREIYSAVARLDKQGLLPVTYHGVYTLFVPDDAPNAVAKLKALANEFNSDNIKIDTLKVFFDGILETRTAAVSDDYLDTPGNKGEALLTREQLSNIILQLEAEGLNLHVHAVGDRATTTVLDAIEEARSRLGRPQTIRIAICHLETVKDTDFERFKTLNVIANFTPHWWIGGDNHWVAQGIGDEVNRMQRVQPLLVEGATVSFSSDITDAFEWKSHRADPYLGMQSGHTRQDVGSNEATPVFPPLSDRVTRQNMVNGYTSNAAYQLDRETEIGSIVVGKRADLVVLNQDLFTVDKYLMHKTKPVAVFTRGQIVFGALNEN
ncbi:MAG: amidohydrolase [Luminiphilus sp.]